MLAGDLADCVRRIWCFAGSCHTKSSLECYEQTLWCVILRTMRQLGALLLMPLELIALGRPHIFGTSVDSSNATPVAAELVAVHWRGQWIMDPT